MRNPKIRFRLFVCSEKFGNYFAYFTSLEQAKQAVANLKNSVFWTIRDMANRKMVTAKDKESDLSH